MRFGLFTCGYQRLPLEKAFADAAEMGYDFIELWGGRPHAYAPDLLAGEAEEVCRLAGEYGVPVAVYTPEHNAYPFNYMCGSSRQWEDAMDYLTCGIRAARLLGAEYMLLSVGHGGSAPPAERWERLLRSLRRLCAAAEREGQKLILETLTPWESNTCTRCDELQQVLEEVGSPFLYGMCDLVPPYVQGENPAAYAKVLGGRLRHLHLVDSDGVSDTHLIPGEGTMNLKDVLAELRTAGYDGTATIELVTNYIDAPSAAAKMALERAKELLF